MTDCVDIPYRRLNLRAPIREILIENTHRRYEVFYNANKASFLNGLCEAHGSDKGGLTAGEKPYPWLPHNYADYIERHFGHCREHVRNVFECGLGTNNPDLVSSMGERGRPGASLRVWRDYFPNARVVGADVDRDILFAEDRIVTHHVDQTDAASVAALWDAVGKVEFDLMIDDGLHTFEAGVSLLEGSLHKLKAGGIYIIEDVAMETIVRFLDYFQDKPLNYEVVTLYRGKHRLGDNSMIVIRA